MPKSSGSTPTATNETTTPASGPTGIPVLDEVEVHLNRSDFSGAVRAVFPRIMIDIQRAYSLSFPTGSAANPAPSPTPLGGAAAVDHARV